VSGRGEGTHPGGMAHPARARQRVRAAKGLISPKAAGAPIYAYHRREREEELTEVGADIIK
jgi:hypothetical protein